MADWLFTLQYHGTPATINKIFFNFHLLTKPDFELILDNLIFTFFALQFEKGNDTTIAQTT